MKIQIVCTVPFAFYDAQGVHIIQSRFGLFSVVEAVFNVRGILMGGDSTENVCPGILLNT